MHTYIHTCTCMRDGRDIERYVYTYVHPIFRPPQSSLVVLGDIEGTEFETTSRLKLKIKDGVAAQRVCDNCLTLKDWI